MENFPDKAESVVNLNETQKSYLVSCLEQDLGGNLDTYDNSSFADNLNGLYKKLTGKDHPKWMEMRKTS